MERLPGTARSGLMFLHLYRQQRPFELDDERFVTLHEWLLRELSTMDTLADLIHAERESYHELCSRCHKRYLTIKEAEANRNFLSGAKPPAPSTGEKLSGFGRKVYDRVRDLKKLIDLRACKNVVMVGSGPFPATLLWLHDNFPMPHYLGLDIESACVKMAAELVAALGIDNIHFERVDGSQFDFEGVDFVYVANHVVPKRAVLEQIARSTSVRQVVVREPTPVGELLAEAARPGLPPVFFADAAGAASGIMSYDLFLRRV